METGTAGVNTVQDKFGNTYTNSVQNDNLTNEDFLKLMIEEIKMQDPTKPMDSKEMLKTQMQMSSISTNKETIKAMQSMTASFQQSALASATSLMGKSIEDGQYKEDGVSKVYTVRSIENNDGKVELRVQELAYMKHMIALENGDKKEKLDYNEAGEIFDAKGKKTGNKLVLESPGNPALKDGKLQILDKDNNPIDSSKYAISVNPLPVYNNELVNIPFEKVTKVFEM